jgi:Uma2 family endonuclease
MPMPNMHEGVHRTLRHAVIASLGEVRGRAEIVDGAIVRMSPGTVAHARAVRNIVISLDRFAARAGRGEAFADGLRYYVDLPHRWSFCPDVAFHVVPDGEEDPPELGPVFIVEVRGAMDYGHVAERRLAAKRAEYFATATQVVWDVDVEHEGIVRVFRASAPSEPTVYRRGMLADAAPAVPGWTFAVDDLLLRSSR